MLTGIHMLHVVVVLVVLAIVAYRLRADAYDGDVVLLEVAATYWHMVDLLWIHLFTLFYLLP